MFKGRKSWNTYLIYLFCKEKIHRLLKLIENVEKKYDRNILARLLYFSEALQSLESGKEVEPDSEKAWPVLSQSWVINITSVKSQKKKSKQLEVLADFGLKSSPEFPNICLIIAIMISTPSNSSPTERAYIILEIICTKQRNCVTASHV